MVLIPNEMPLIDVVMSDSRGRRHSTESDEQKIACVQAVQCNALQRYRVVGVDGNDGVVADLVAGRQHLPEILEHAAVELDLIAAGNTDAEWLGPSPDSRKTNQPETVEQAVA